VGIAEKSTKEAAEKSARRCSQKEHPLEQTKPLEQPRRAAAGAATKSSRRSSHVEQPQEQPRRAAAEAVVTAVAG